ncbi:MAG: LysE family translocator [Desulfobulbaceae bacterium]|nr:MAG: LysE family translocator [Desulfobulbaceae bacterium]
MEIWFTFVLVSTLILVIPGPTIILVVSQSVTHGKKSTVPLVAGVLLGDFTAMAASLLGLGALMATSAALFTTFKWLGALYLIYLGIKLFFDRPNQQQSDEIGATQKSSRSLLSSSFIVTALNPKSIAFFVTFLPQFINPTQPVVSQLTLFGSTFLVLATINAALYAIFAVQLKQYIRRANVQKWVNRCGGSTLIGAGIFTARMIQAK